MARPAADNPDVLVRRMTVEDEIAGVGVFVRAHTRLDDWRASERRDAMGQPGARTIQARRVGHTIRGVDIDRYAMLVDAHLDAAAVDVRGSIDTGRKVDPCRHARGVIPAVARRQSEV